MTLFFPTMPAIAVGLTTCLSTCLMSTAATPPIQVLIDIHADPMGGTEPMQLARYEDWVVWTNWALDQCDVHGGQVSFTSTGEFMEWIVEMPSSGTPLMTRLYDHGDGAIGTHSHSKYRVALHDWQSLPANPTLAEIESHWADHMHAIDDAIEFSLGITDADELRAVNCIRGAHVPSEDDEWIFHDLAETWGIPIRQQGPAERFYGFFDHYVWNPFRLSEDNLLVHDPDAPMIISPFGPVVGNMASHHGVMQDMRVPAVKGRFIMELLNWLDDVEIAGTGRTWCTGWSAHCHDLEPGSTTRNGFVQLLPWFRVQFIEATVSGHQAAEYSSIRRSATIYGDWEAEHPGETPFSYALTVRDDEAYPWLRPVLDQLSGKAVIADVSGAGAVRGHHLGVMGGADAWVVYGSTGEESVADLSGTLPEGLLAAIEPGTGHYRFIDASTVPVRKVGVMLVDSTDVIDYAWLPDQDDDSTIGVNDLLSLLESWGPCPPLPETCHADLDGDGLVGIDDLLRLLAAWE